MVKKIVDIDPPRQQNGYRVFIEIAFIENGEFLDGYHDTNASHPYCPYCGGMDFNDLKQHIKENNCGHYIPSNSMKGKLDLINTDPNAESFLMEVSKSNPASCLSFEEVTHKEALYGADIGRRRNISRPLPDF